MNQSLLPPLSRLILKKFSDRRSDTSTDQTIESLLTYDHIGSSRLIQGFLFKIQFRRTSPATPSIIDWTSNFPQKDTSVSLCEPFNSIRSAGVRRQRRKWKHLVLQERWCAFEAGCRITFEHLCSSHSPCVYSSRSAKLCPRPLVKHRISATLGRFAGLPIKQSSLRNTCFQWIEKFRTRFVAFCPPDWVVHHTPKRVVLNSTRPRK